MIQIHQFVQYSYIVYVHVKLVKPTSILLILILTSIKGSLRLSSVKFITPIMLESHNCPIPILEKLKLYI